ncbi:uncharacterized protein PV09_08347 [Verruconis gallopava]|uniref:Sulfite efflux pump SSU1 n=1 Tax=Verruconis gallopava TaxID=253628 RepID=A0A0D2A138_9PEZI|nr:uncharacterized protein PV09_08347 [Verruconis gallopava]KIV99989.1 hypothetical protein PV09_08347 [Verruconis gallopava]
MFSPQHLGATIMTAAQTTHSSTPSQVDAEKQCNAGPLRRSAFRALVQDFAPIWFTWCMNSGILSILTHQCPYQFPGLQIVSTVLYVFDLTLFILFSLLFILRFAIFKSLAYAEIVSNQTDLMFCACWPISWMTLTTLTPLICSNAYWGGHAFSLLGYVMWWVAVAWCLVVLTWAFGVMIEQHKASEARIPMPIILPAVSVSTAAVEGAFVVSLSYEISPRLAVPVIVVGFMLVGIGTLLGLILTTYLFHGYLAHGWHAPEQAASVFIFIGPMGQGAAALQQLGRAAQVYGAFAGYNKGTFLTAEAAVSVEASCTIIALMLSGLGFVWLIFSIYSMARCALRRELLWTPGWNAIIFPTGTLVSSMSLFALDMDSPAFRVTTALLIVILFIVYFINLAFTVWNVMKGRLLIVREDERIKERIRAMQKDK